MATWITLLGSDVRISASEKTTVDSISPQQTLQQCVDAACNLARGYIGKRNPLADAPAVPPEVKKAVLAIAAADYLEQAVGSDLVDKVRQGEVDKAYKLLRDIASGDFAITAPDVEEATPPVTPSPGTAVPCRKFQPNNQDGI
jgi:hypothetical protein